MTTPIEKPETPDGTDAVDQSELIRRYAMHIIGPDDIIEQPDELTALREANTFNTLAALEHAEYPNCPYLMALVVPLEH